MQIPPDMDVEEELWDNDLRELSEETLLNTRGLLPWVLTILDKLGAEIITQEEFKRLYLERGQRPWSFFGRAVTISVTDVPANYPTLDYLRKLPDHYFGSPVPFENTTYGKVPFSLARLDNRIFVRCHLRKKDIAALEGKVSLEDDDPYLPFLQRFSETV